MKNPHIFSQKMYLKAEFWLGYSRTWLEKVQMIIPLQLLYFPNFASQKMKLKTGEMSNSLTIFGYNASSLGP